MAETKDPNTSNHAPLSSFGGEKLQGLIWIVDDDVEMRELMVDYLRGQGHQIRAFASAVEALAELHIVTNTQANAPEVIVSDIQMPRMSGIEFATELKRQGQDIPVLLVTAFGSVESAVLAMRTGVFDYVTKPFQLSELGHAVDRALQLRRLRADNRVLRQALAVRVAPGTGLLGKSKAMLQVMDLVSRVAQVNSNVLITGESGTGKEMVARAIHASGPRSKEPFVAVNCTAIPENLLESELFGHAKGSFTGAHQRKKGLLEEAHGGTFFLDEVGDMELSLQAKLLRVIQERKIRAVGDTQSRDIDVRIIAATHKDLKASIREGLFREDLFYRLSVIPIHIPPLRHRKEDIPELAQHFLLKAAAQNGLNVRGFSQAALRALTEMRWEGNVRELENLVERTAVLSKHNILQAEDLPQPEMAQVEDFYADSTRDFPTLEQLEKRYIYMVMQKTGGKKDKASQILGINRRTLYRKEREYGFIDADPSFEDALPAADHETN